MLEPPPSTLAETWAETWRIVTSPPILWLMAALLALMVFTGPMRTLETQSLPFRILHWGTIILGSNLVGTWGQVRLRRSTRIRALPVAARLLTGSLLIGGMVWVFLTVFLALLHWRWPPPAEQALATGVIALLVTALILGLQDLLGRITAPPAPAPEAEPAGSLDRHRQAGVVAPPAAPAAEPSLPPPLLSRLSPGQRGRILALSAENHHVRVLTDRGSEMILMRLADAITLAARPGLRLHRSHWAALSAITDARRTGDTAEVTLLDGTNLPVSRSRIADLQEAGFLRAPQTEGAA